MFLPRTLKDGGQALKLTLGFRGWGLGVFRFEGLGCGGKTLIGRLGCRSTFEGLGGFSIQG